MWGAKTAVMPEVWRTISDGTGLPTSALRLERMLDFGSPDGNLGLEDAWSSVRVAKSPLPALQEDR
jgi:hypothetical protein